MYISVVLPLWTLSYFWTNFQLFWDKFSVIFGQTCSYFGQTFSYFWTNFWLFLDKLCRNPLLRILTVLYSYTIGSQNLENISSLTQPDDSSPFLPLPLPKKWVKNRTPLQKFNPFVDIDLSSIHRKQQTLGTFFLKVFDHHADNYFLWLDMIRKKFPRLPSSLFLNYLIANCISQIKGKHLILSKWTTPVILMQWAWISSVNCVLIRWKW